jgi:hypothetical protein
MLHRYFAEPYQFIPPYRGRFWCRLTHKLLTEPYCQRNGLRRVEFRHLDRLRASLAQRAGILLTPNHSRWADGLALTQVGRALGQCFYILMSYHVFKQSAWQRWVLQRIGGYSILREGTDRESLRATVDILQAADRPIVVFPEGTWFRQNDRLAPLQEGASLMARFAARTASRPIVVHPIAIKYWLLHDPRSVLDERLARLERLLLWKPQRGLGLVERIDKFTDCFLATKEIEHLGSPQPGELTPRLRALAATIISRQEKQLDLPLPVGSAMARIRHLRIALVAQLVEFAGDEEECQRVHRMLDDLLVCEGLESQSPEYLRERPSFERLAEAVQRLEEMVFDGREEPIVPFGAIVQIGGAIDVHSVPRHRHKTGEIDLLTGLIACSIQQMLTDLLEEGPPPNWNCPPPIERASSQLQVASLLAGC